MSMIEQLKPQGSLRIVVTAADGTIVQDFYVRNLVVNTGLEYIASRMMENGRQNEISHMAIGTDSIEPTPEDVGLGTEEYRSPLNVLGGTLDGASVIYEATFGAGELNVTEAGLFNDETTGIMLCRTVFNPISKREDDVIGITWTLSIL